MAIPPLPEGPGGDGRIVVGAVDRPDVPGGYLSDRIVIRLAPAYQLANLPDGGQSVRSMRGPSGARESQVAAVFRDWHVQAVAPAYPGVGPGGALYRLDRYFVVSLPPGSNPKGMIDDLKARVPEVEQAELEGIGGLLTAPPNDPLFPSQWGLSNTGQTMDGQQGIPGADIDALRAWDLASDTTDVVLAIVDTGISRSHPDLEARLVPGRNFNGGAPENTDDSSFISHGTACAGIVGANVNNGIGIAGLCRRASLMPIRVTNYLGFSTELMCSQGIVWCSDNGARIASISLGFANGPDYFADAVSYARFKDVVVVASTGNTPGIPIYYPARFPGVVAVGATDNRDQLATFTTTGPRMTVVAPGVNIITTWDTSTQPDTYTYQSGTSMACPLVAGLACLIRAADPLLSEAQVRLVIAITAEDLGDPGWDERFGYGRINAASALAVVTGIPPGCAADWNQDGRVDSGDVFQFMADYFGGSADFDQNGVTDSTDFFGFIVAFFQGC